MGKYIWIILLSISTAFSFAIGIGDKNLLLIGILSCIPVLIILKYPYLQISEIWIYCLFITMVICGLRHPASFRISTVLYSLLFFLCFIFYLRLINDGILKIERYLLIVKVIIISYFITLIIQQFCVFVGSSYVFNQIHTWEEGAYKLNSLAPEPSHTARILTLLMYSYICMREVILGREYNLLKDLKEDILIWFFFLYSMLTMGSGAAFIVLPLFLLKFFKLKNLTYVIPVVFLGIFILTKMEITAVNRAFLFSKSVITADENKIILADHSASFRIIPTILYLKMFDISSINTWFGFGIDYDVELFPSLIPGLPEGTSIGGIFPTFLMNYGLISAMFLFLMIRRHCFRKIWSFDTFLWLIMIGPVPLNTQLAWLSFLLLATNKYFYTLIQNTENFSIMPQRIY